MPARTMFGRAEPHERYAWAAEPVGRRRALLERVRPGSQVLDVGCWSGSAGRLLAAERAAVVDGVEPADEIAVTTQRHYRTVYTSAIEDVLPELLAERPGAYDSLLFLDVLEHLVAPDEVLAASKGLLRPGGTALVSLPNIAHWTIRWALLCGRWQYADSGLLDRTHLRFFTQSTAQQLVREAGWRITWRSASVDARPLWPLTRLPALLDAWPSMFAVQFLLELRPADARVEVLR